MGFWLLSLSLEWSSNDLLTHQSLRIPKPSSLSRNRLLVVPMDVTPLLDLTFLTRKEAWIQQTSPSCDAYCPSHTMFIQTLIPSSMERLTIHLMIIQFYNLFHKLVLSSKRTTILWQISTSRDNEDFFATWGEKNKRKDWGRSPVSGQ